LKKKPFRDQSLQILLKGNESNYSKTPVMSSSKKLICSPSLNSKFSPISFIKNSPCISRMALLNNKKISDTILSKYTHNKSNLFKTNDKEEDLNMKRFKVTRKLKKNLKNLDEAMNMSMKEELPKDLQILQKFEKLEVIEFLSTTQYEIKDIEDTKLEESNNFLETDKNIISKTGFLYKVSKGFLKKLWYQLVDKDFYCNNSF